MKQSWDLWWILTAWLRCLHWWALFSGWKLTPMSYISLRSADPANSVLFRLLLKASLCRLCISFSFCPLSSIGARPKLTKRNSMDSVELWKFSTVKVSPYRLLSTECYWTFCQRMSFHCRMVRTKTLRAYPGETRVNFHSRAKGRAILTVSRRMRGRGWTRL